MKKLSNTKAKFKKGVAYKKSVFLQDSAPSHRSNLVQNFLKEKLDSKFIKHTEWLPSSPDCNPLGYHFWNKIKERVYKDRLGQPLKSEDELKKKIKKVWS